MFEITVSQLDILIISILVIAVLGLLPYVIDGLRKTSRSIDIKSYQKSYQYDEDDHHMLLPHEKDKVLGRGTIRKKGRNRHYENNS